jgi:hypothetical protein
MSGVPYSEGGEVKRRPFHGYTMKQAIQEGFILDVLKSYTPVESYYRLANWPTHRVQELTPLAWQAAKASAAA